MAKSKSKIKKPEKQKNTDISEIFEHYQNAGIIKHRKITESMRLAIKKFMRQTGSDKRNCCDVIDRHKGKITETASMTYKINPRPLVELFGQKSYGGTQLIGEQYLDGGKYTKIIKKTIIEMNDAELAVHYGCDPETGEAI